MNVYVLGKTFLVLARELCINAPAIGTDLTLTLTLFVFTLHGQCEVLLNNGESALISCHFTCLLCRYVELLIYIID